MGRRCHPRPRNIFARTGRAPTRPGAALNAVAGGNAETEDPDPPGSGP